MELRTAGGERLALVPSTSGTSGRLTISYGGIESAFLSPEHMRLLARELDRLAGQCEAVAAENDSTAR